MFNVKEAIHSCAMEHRDGCGCQICKAAGGDREAFGYVLAGVMLGGADVVRPRGKQTRSEEDRS